MECSVGNGIDFDFNKRTIHALIIYNKNQQNKKNINKLFNLIDCSKKKSRVIKILTL